MPKLLEAFSRLPGGQMIDRTYGDVARILRTNYLDSQAEKDRIAEMELRIDLYEDRTEAILKAQIDENYEHAARRAQLRRVMDESLFMNLTRRIINEISTVYSESALRSVTAGNDQYQLFLRDVRFQRQMEITNQRLNLCNEVVVWFGTRGDGAGNNEPRMRVITPDKFWAIGDPNNPLELVALVLKLDSKGVERIETSPWYTLWTADEKMYLDRAWRPAEGFEVMSNPIGRIPGELLHRQMPTTKLLDDDTGKDLVSGHKAINLINLLLMEEQKSGSVLGYAQGDVKQMATGQALHRSFIAHIPEDVTMGSIDLKSDPATFIATAKTVVHQIAANYGIPSDVFDLSHDAKSGFELSVRRTKLKEMRRDQIDDFTDHERVLNGTSSAVMVAEASSTYHFAPEGFQIDFGEQEIPRSRKEALENRKMARNMGLSNPIDEIIRDNPDLNETQAEAVLKRNVNIYAAFIEVIRALNIPTGVQNSFGQSPEDNGAEGGPQPTEEAEE